MEDDKFDELQQFLESQVTQAWWKTQRNPYAFSTWADTLGHNLELQLQTNSRELDRTLNALAQKSIDEALFPVFDPIDFSSYIRPSSEAGYKEVYVGGKWVLVPESTCVEFIETTVSLPDGSESSGFKVTLYEEGTSNWAQFENSHSLDAYEQQMTAITGQEIDVQLQPIQYKNNDTGLWEDYGRPAMGFMEENIGFGDDLINGSGVIAGDSFLRQPGKVRRNYTYKITKQAQKMGSTIKPGAMNTKVHKLARLARNGKLASLSKITKPLGPLATGLQGVVIADELYNDSWDAHTVANGALLVVGIVATGAGAPIVLAGIAVYGILDYFFDISEGLDNAIGRESGFWDNNIQQAPIDREVLFQRAVERFEKNNHWERPEIEQDNTRVKKPFMLKPQIKD